MEKMNGNRQTKDTVNTQQARSYTGNNNKNQVSEQRLPGSQISRKSR